MGRAQTYDYKNGEKSFLEEYGYFQKGMLNYHNEKNQNLGAFSPRSYGSVAFKFELGMGPGYGSVSSRHAPQTGHVSR